MEKTNLNNGTKFEITVAKLTNGAHDGRANRKDVYVNGKAIECKFFTHSVQKRVSASGKDFPKGAKQAVQNYANGCPIRQDRDLRKSVEDYCKGFDLLYIGVGADGSNPEEIQVLTSTEAVEWLIPRSYARGKRIRFGFHSNTTKGGGNKSRLATLIKNGFVGLE